MPELIGNADQVPAIESPRIDTRLGFKFINLGIHLANRVGLSASIFGATSVKS
jgi:hypothetical protein